MATFMEKNYKKRKKALDKLGFKTYSEFLSSNLWKEFRKQLTKKPVCCFCRKKAVKYHLHHQSYKELLSPDGIVILCPKCHKGFHFR